MNNNVKAVLSSIILPAILFAQPAIANDDEEPVCFYESRLGIGKECGIYHSEVSPAKAFLDTIVNRPPSVLQRNHPVIIDVRSIPEYKAGHPKWAYNVPYPYIYEECGGDGSRRPDGACISRGTRLPQTDEDFVAFVESILPDKDRPLYLLCRTGSRSVDAANRLTEAGYINVRNIWEGFVGVYLNAPQYVFDTNGDPVLWDDDGDPATPEVPLVENLPVDLNHDMALTDADKNGWINHQALPSTKTLSLFLMYTPELQLYFQND